MKIINTRNRNSLIHFIEAYLKYWTEKRCNRINTLDIRIDGPFLKIVQGKIDRVEVKASEIDFKNILINQLDLYSNTIELSINFKKGMPTISLSKTFNINFSVSFENDQLTRMFKSKELSSIGEWFCNEFFSECKFISIIIEKNHLRVKAFNDKLKVYEEILLELESRNGKLIVKENSVKKEVDFPIDNSIYIKNFILHDNHLSLNCNSIVKP